MKDYLRSFNFLTESEIEMGFQYATVRKMNKSERFISAGETCKSVAFINSGIFRSFYISDKGEEMTYCINFPGIFTTAYSSYISGMPTVEYIEAVSAAEVLVISKIDIEKLATESYNWLCFLKVVAEQQYLELEQRIFQLQKDSAKQRYLNMLERHPEYIRHIPLQYLASYLGITQRHLSRLRNELLLDNCPKN